MTKEALVRAKELEHQIDTYGKIIYAMTFPYTKFRLFKRRAYIGSAGYNANNEITLSDPELAKLIAEYCRDKIKRLNTELEEI